MWVGFIQSTERLNRTKRQRKIEAALVLTIDLTLPSALLLLRLSDLDWNLPSAPQLSGPQTTPLAFLELQLVDGGSWDFSREPVPYKKSLSICISPSGSVSLENSG